MRCHLIRSAIRAVLAAGLIASCQNATLFASWKDSLHPVGGTCFVHDLSVAAHETNLCIAAAKQFELRMHVDAIMSSIGIRTKQFADTGTNLLFNFSRSRNALISSIENRAVELVQWIKIPDTLPIAIAQSADENDFDGDWNCGQWCQDARGSVSRQLPFRDGPNILVYMLNSESKSAESDLCQTESDLCQEVIALDTISYAAPSFIQTWQVGMDPVCPEVIESSSACRWSDCYAQPSICCPVEIAAEAIATGTCALPSVTAGIRPPTLDAECDDRKTAIAVENLDEPMLETAPLSYSHRMAIDFAMRAISNPAVDSRIRMSKSLANPIRTLGQFLVDFAGKLDSQVEQVEMARRDINQR